MRAKPNKPARSGRRGDPISLAPLTPDQALAGLLRVNPADVRKLEEAEAKAKKAKGGKKGSKRR